MRRRIPYLNVGSEWGKSDSEAAVKQARESTPIDVGQYIALRTYAESVSGLCGQVGETTGQPDTTLRLVSFVQEVRDKTWGDIKSALTRFVVHN